MKTPDKLGWLRRRHSDSPGTMNKAKRQKLERILSDPIPGVLYFPSKIVKDLEEIREYNEYTYGQLVAWAFKLQLPRWNKFYKFVMTPYKPGEPKVWPENPMFALACVAFVHWIRTFNKMMEDPDAIDATLEQLKKDAPPDWSFRSLEELKRDDPADWWKAPESE